MTKTLLKTSLSGSLMAMVSVARRPQLFAALVQMRQLRPFLKRPAAGLLVVMGRLLSPMVVQVRPKSALFAIKASGLAP
jgi:hypothetical protein